MALLWSWMGILKLLPDSIINISDRSLSASVDKHLKKIGHADKCSQFKAFLALNQILMAILVLFCYSQLFRQLAKSTITNAGTLLLSKFMLDVGKAFRNLKVDIKLSVLTCTYDILHLFCICFGKKHKYYYCYIIFAKFALKIARKINSSYCDQLPFCMLVACVKFAITKHQGKNHLNSISLTIAVWLQHAVLVY